MTHTTHNFYESIDVNNIKVCNMKLKFDEIPNEINLPLTSPFLLKVVKY